jgi:hypothetical protein
LKIYTTHHGLRDPDGWVVVPISTKYDPAPNPIAVFDVEADAKALAMALNIAESIHLRARWLKPVQHMQPRPPVNDNYAGLPGCSQR